MTFKFNYSIPPTEELDSTLSYEDLDHVTDTSQQQTVEYSPSDIVSENVKEEPETLAGKKHKLEVSYL